MARLRGVLAHAVHLAHRRRLGITDGERADPARRRQVAFEEDRGQPEHVGNVVEPGARIVGGEQRGRIDLKREQVADRVGVLGAIQTVHERPARLRVRGRDAVERRLERRHQRPPLLVGRRGPARRRHHAGAHLPNDLFPQFDVAANVGGVGDVER